MDSGIELRNFFTGETFLDKEKGDLIFFAPALSLVFAGGLRLLEVSLPEDDDDCDLDLEPDADDEPVYEDDSVVTDGDAALGFPVDFAISFSLSVRLKIESTRERKTNLENSTEQGHRFDPMNTSRDSDKPLSNNNVQRPFHICFS